MELPTAEEIETDIRNILGADADDQVVHKLSRYVIESVEEALLYKLPSVHAPRLLGKTIIKDIQRLEGSDQDD